MSLLLALPSDILRSHIWPKLSFSATEKLILLLPSYPKMIIYGKCV